MNTTIEKVLSTYGIIGCVILLVLYAVYRLLEKWIDRRVDSVWQMKEAGLKQRLELHLRFVKTVLNALPKVPHRISDARNAIRLYSMSPNTDTALKVHESAQLVADILYSNQMYMRDNTYDAAHLMKREFEKASNILRDVKIGGPYPPIPDSLVAEIDRLYEIYKLSAGQHHSDLVAEIGVLK